MASRSLPSSNSPPITTNSNLEDEMVLINDYNNYNNINSNINNNTNTNITPDPIDHDELLFLNGLNDFENNGLMDISNLASWEISSFKPGNDLKALKADSSLTYWQSDGLQPHNLIIRFTKCVNIQQISIFLNYSVDESYTPDKIAILAGSGEHDLIEVCNLELFEPVGWQNIEFNNISDSKLLKCFILKIKFISNHQNGKDCHVRGIKVLSPMTLNNSNLNPNSISNIDINDSFVGFTSKKLLCESLIR